VPNHFSKNYCTDMKMFLSMIKYWHLNHWLMCLSLAYCSSMVQCMEVESILVQCQAYHLVTQVIVYFISKFSFVKYKLIMFIIKRCKLHRIIKIANKNFVQFLQPLLGAFSSTLIYQHKHLVLLCAQGVWILCISG
jgi:hypothetical protein